MDFQPDKFYHVYNQGNNRRRLFEPHTDEYIIFLFMVRRYILPHVDILAYCLMPNHFHMMIKTDERCLFMKKSGKMKINPVSFGIRILLSSYTRMKNKRQGCTGSIFRQGTHARCLNSESEPSFVDKVKQDDLSNVFRYIHQNPVKAKLAETPADWPYSSYREYAGIRNGTLVNKKIAFEFGFASI